MAIGGSSRGCIATFDIFKYETKNMRVKTM